MMVELRLEGYVEGCQDEEEKYVPGRKNNKGQEAQARDPVLGNWGGRGRRGGLQNVGLCPPTLVVVLRVWCSFSFVPNGFLLLYDDQIA